MPSQLDLTLGAAEIGALLGCMLYGAVTVQVYTYSGRCKNDSMWLILIVIAVWVLETLFTVFTICWIYDMSVSNYGNPVFISDGPWTFDSSVTMVHGLIGCIVQSFFAYRIWRVSNSLVWPCLAWASAISRVGLNILMCYGIFKTKNIVVFSHEYGLEFTADLSQAVAVDILNSAALTWYLSRMRSQFRHTLHILSRVILYSIATGTITSITGLCLIVTRAAMPTNYIWLGIFQIHARMSSNSFMVLLNARSGLKKKHDINMAVANAVVNNSALDSRRTDRAGISIQMVSFTETGDPTGGQKESFEGEDSDITHTAVMETPLKS